MFLFRGYNKLLNTNPLATKSLTGGFMFGLADFFGQSYQNSEIQQKVGTKPNYDFRRTFISVTMGTIFMTPLFHYWFTHVLPGVVQRIPFPKNSPASYGNAASLVIDQTVWAFSITCYYFIMINLLEHQSLDRGVNMVKNNIKETMISNWKIWPAAQVINFWLVPIPFRVLWVNFVGLLWQTYLVQVQHQNQ